MSTAVAPALLGRVALAFRRQLAAGIVFNQQVFDHLGLGLSASDGQFLTLLQLQGPMSPGELARLSGLRTGTVTGVIDRLERAGYVERTRHASDRRKVIVSLNEARIAHELGPYYAPQIRHFDEVIANYTPDQLALIADFLERIVGQPYDAAEVAKLGPMPDRP